MSDLHHHPGEGPEQAPPAPPVHAPRRTQGTTVLLGVIAVAFIAQTAEPTLVELGALVPALVGGPYHEPWRLLTSAVLHGGLFHVGFNGYALWIAGSLLEPPLGTARFLALTLFGALGGALGVVVASPAVSATVGASGAIFALMGAAAVVAQRSGVGAWRSGLGQLLILNLVITFGVPGISIGGHVGGLVAGLFAGAALGRGSRGPAARTREVWAMLVGALVLGAIAVVIAPTPPS